MMHRTYTKWNPAALTRLSVGLLLVGLADPIKQARADDLASRFAHPPVQARPMVYWTWINGHVNRAAISRDLEHLQRVGLGGALLFDVPPLHGDPNPAPRGPVAFMSSEWLDLVNFAAEESHRLGLEFGVVLCSAWNSGGPWIKPRQNNQRIASSQLRLVGPAAGAIRLPPPSTDPDYVDAAVVAWPTPANESRLYSEYPPVITVNGDAGDGRSLRTLIDGDRQRGTAVPAPQEGTPTVIAFTFREPVTVGRLYIREDPGFGIRTGRLEAAAPDGAFRRLAEFETNGKIAVEAEFSPATAAVFRLVATGAQNHAVTTGRMRLQEVTLMEPGKWAPVAPVVRNWALKNATVVALVRAPDARRLSDDHLLPTLDLPGRPALRPDAVVPLTDRLDPSGRLAWEAPAGDWTILRLGMEPFHSRPYNAKGREGNEEAYESDKMSAEASRAHYEGMARAILARLSSAGRQGLRFFHLDSWEGEANHWTRDFLAEFKRRRGYDLTPYLPVLDGRIVGDGRTADRVLWDYRRTIGDLNNDGHFQALADLCRADGLGLSAQAGHGFQANMDTIGGISRADFPSGEFWYRGRNGPSCDLRNSIKDAASAVNLHGRAHNLIESFTTGQWRNFWPAPADLKRAGDFALAEGVSRMFIHAMWLDPKLDNTPPGLSWTAGIHVGPSITWMPDGRGVFDYFSRVQLLLQAGVVDHDVLYFLGDGMPNLTPKREELWFDLPAGYDYDATDGRALRERLAVRDGRIVLPHGATYRVLALPPIDTMLPETLATVHRLVQAGAAVYGPKPLRSPSLSGQPGADREVARLADELWGRDPAAAGSRRVGRGTVHWGRALAEVFAAHGVAPQVEVRPAERAATLKHYHRRTREGQEIYFLASQSEEANELEILFRSVGKRPFFWHPDTGAIAPVPVYRVEGERTRLPVRFGPGGSVFVVFAAAVDSVPQGFAQVERDGVVLFPSEGCHALPLDFADGPRGWTIAARRSGRYRLTRPEGRAVDLDLPAPAAQELSGPWEIAWQKNRGAPERSTMAQLQSWTADAHPEIKYFSGYGTYTKQIEVADAFLADGQQVWLDLGAVGDVARVSVNGRVCGTRWHPPYRIEVTAALHPGLNRLEVAVVNTWVNRLIGDDLVPPGERVTNALIRDRIPPADLDLHPSGLVGPVTLAAVRGFSIATDR